MSTSSKRGGIRMGETGDGGACVVRLRGEVTGVGRRSGGGLSALSSASPTNKAMKYTPRARLHVFFLRPCRLHMPK